MKMGKRLMDEEEEEEEGETHGHSFFSLSKKCYCHRLGIILEIITLLPSSSFIFKLKEGKIN